MATWRLNDPAESFCACSTALMQEPSSLMIASSILSAPAWVRLGIAVPDEQMWEKATSELAETIVEQLAWPKVSYNADQILPPLSLG